MQRDGQWQTCRPFSLFDLTHSLSQIYLQINLSRPVAVVRHICSGERVHSMYKAVNITDAAPDPGVRTGVQTSVLHKRYLSSWHAATRALRKLRRALERLQGGGLARFLTRWREFASGARRHQMRQHNALRRAAGLTQLPGCKATRVTYATEGEAAARERE